MNCLVIFVLESSVVMYSLNNLARRAKSWERAKLLKMATATAQKVGVNESRPKDILINFSEYVPQAMGILYPF